MRYTKISIATITAGISLLTWVQGLVISLKDISIIQVFCCILMGILGISLSIRLVRREYLMFSDIFIVLLFSVVGVFSKIPIAQIGALLVASLVTLLMILSRNKLSPRKWV